MNASNMLDPLALIGEVERLSTQFDEQLDAWESATDSETREQILRVLEETMRSRGTLIDTLVQWFGSPQNKRTVARGRRDWLDALQRLREGDTRRAKQLGVLVTDSSERLRQRTAHQALFIYQRGDL
ncbi:MAG: hypothetical protein N2663_06200 [Chlorobi bacterium]|nr:hypothetical protein [Chlorobiota bacterium]